MNLKSLVITMAALASFGFSAQAETAQNAKADAQIQNELPNIMEELNSFDPNIEEVLKELDKEHELETGIPAIVDEAMSPFFGSCYRQTCKVWVSISKSSQSMRLYIDGNLEGEYPVSTGVSGYGTPDFDQHPNGRIYNAYSSRKFPGGDYKGLGNMPYAVFIRGGFAIHGTPKSNWSKLGQRASHGCIRVHPDVGYRFNRLVRNHGIHNVWITVD